MMIVKKINNNVAIGIDSRQCELVVFGKGIGFGEMPYELKDLSIISQTFYGIDKRNYELLNEIDESILNVCSKIVEIAKLKIHSELNPTLVITLADHINFAINRMQKGIDIKSPLHYDVQHLYTTEVDIGRTALELIKKEIDVSLPQSEEISIAIHLINAQESHSHQNQLYDFNRIIDGITKTVEGSMNNKIDRKSYAYSRFVMHLYYLFNRKESNPTAANDHQKTFESVIKEFPKEYRCALAINEYLSSVLEYKLIEEEFLYLMLHIIRLCGKEDCNQ